MEASKITIDETVPASRKLGADDARQLLKQASRLVVAKGKKVSAFEIGRQASDEAVAAMLGPTGNLRAPTVKVGRTLLVGFEQGAYSDLFG